MNENFFGERMQTLGGKIILKRKAGSEKSPIEEKKSEETKADVPKFNVSVDKEEKMIILPTKGNNENDQREAREILKKLQKEKSAFFIDRAKKGKGL